MAQTQIEVTKTNPTTTPTRMPDVWHSFRSDMDRLFDRFAGGFSLPSLRHMMFDVEPAWRNESSFSFSAPAVDVTEDEVPAQTVRNR